jgi:hypothetical protein
MAVIDFCRVGLASVYAGKDCCRSAGGIQISDLEVTPTGEGTWTSRRRLALAGV